VTYRQLLNGNPDFRRLWTGQVISEIGDWLNNISVLALAIELASAGRVGQAIALYAIARHLPLFLFGPIAGVAVDRIDRRRVMIAADVTRAALALGFLLANLFQSLTVIYVVGSSLFAVATFFNAAKRASTPNLVRGTDELLSANSLSASTTAATIAVGSALGGIIATFVGRNVVFVLNALTFLASAEMIRRIRANTRKQKAEGSEQDAVDHDQWSVTIDELHGLKGESKARNASRQSALTAYGILPTAFSLARRSARDFSEGLRYVRNDFTLASIFIVAAGWGLGNGAARALYSIFGARLGEGAGVAEWIARPADFGISVLFVAMGLGGVAGAPLARRFNQSTGEGLAKRMGRSMTLDGVGLAIFSLMPTLLTAALLLVAREMNFAIWWTAQQTIIMKRTSDHYAGRVFASYETLTTLMMVGAMYFAGRASDAYGIQIVAFAGGIVIALSGLLWFVLRRNNAENRENLRKQHAMEETE